MAEGVRYQYQPLKSPGAIRLLELRKDSYNPSTKIFDCKLKIVDIDDADCPVYRAISYTWALPGLDDEDTPALWRPSPLYIRCDGQMLEVSENIFDCLDQKHQLEYADDTEEISYLWIDAISIDQENLEERNQQVALMQRIYANAKDTLAWLGRHDRNSRRAIPLIQRLSQVQQSLPNEPVEHTWKRSFGYGFLHDESFFQSVGMPAPSSADWEATVAFFARGWFHRLWTVQELILSLEHGGIRMLCGDSIIQLGDVENFLSLAVVKGWITSLHLQEYKRTGHATARMALGIEISLRVREAYKANRVTEADSVAAHLRDVFGHFDQSSFDDAKFAWNLSLCRQKAATDQRDRVFASSTLVTKSHPPDHWHLLKADYSKSTCEVYTNASRQIIGSLRNLSWLYFVEDKSFRVHHDLPSWVPDLASKLAPAPIQIGRNHDVFRGCNEAWQETAALAWSSDSAELRLKGFMVDKVIDGMHDMHNVIDNMEFSALLLSAASIPPYVAGESWLTALMDTLIAEACSESLPRDVAEGFDLEKVTASFIHFVKFQIVREIWKWDNSGRAMSENWWDAHADFRQLCDNDGALPSRRDFEEFHSRFMAIYPKNYSAGVDPYITEDAYVQQIHNPNMAFEIQACPYFYFRTFYHTERARIGLAPQSVRPGDEIWVFAGAKVPFIIRQRKTGDYELIGHAHVHGIMQGELFTDGIRPEFIPIVLR